MSTYLHGFLSGFGFALIVGIIAVALYAWHHKKELVDDVKRNLDKLV